MTIKWQFLEEECYKVWVVGWGVGFEEKPYYGETLEEALGYLLLGFTTALDLDIEEYEECAE